MRPRPPQLGIHPGQTLFVEVNFQKRVKVRKRSIERGSKLSDAVSNFCTSTRLIISSLNPEIAMDELNHRHIRRSFAIRNRERFNHGPIFFCRGFELEE